MPKVKVVKHGVSQRGKDGLRYVEVGSVIEVSDAAMKMLKARGLVTEESAASEGGFVNALRSKRRGREPEPVNEEENDG